ncbi:hypothetical protein [Nitrolancea hollandica]|nr:hypothetical protein [Nitrolancea hollandica]
MQVGAVNRIHAVREDFALSHGPTALSYFRADRRRHYQHQATVLRPLRRGNQQSIPAAWTMTPAPAASRRLIERDSVVDVR